MEIKCLGIYFNESQITKEDEPNTELTIKKYTLDRSSQEILARFEFNIPSRSKIVFSVTMDGKKVDNYGTNLPYMESSGVYDTTLFKYPNSAKANKLGIHKIHVKCGLITNIVESQAGLVTWKDAEAISEADFVINLVGE